MIYNFLTFLIIINSILLILVVLVQNSKGGGLASNFSSSTQIMGVKRTNEFVEKATWGLAISLVSLCLLATLFITRPEKYEEETVQQTEQPAEDSQAPVE